jgi:hypothetical protein
LLVQAHALSNSDCGCYEDGLQVAVAKDVHDKV